MMTTMKIVFSGILWLGRGAATMMALVIILALMLGVTTKALAGTGVGANFDLGRINTVDALSRLVGSTNNALLKVDNDDSGASATALDLRVEPGQAPMKVDSSTKVVEFNADQVDGKSASAFLGTGDKAADAIHADQADHAANANKVDGLNADEIGVNGRSLVAIESDSNSVSPKTSTANCPSGKVVVGTGYDIVGAKSDSGHETDVVVDAVTPELTNVEVIAYEEQQTSADWSVYAYAVCAQASF